MATRIAYKIVRNRDSAIRTRIAYKIVNNRDSAMATRIANKIVRNRESDIAKTNRDYLGNTEKLACKILFCWATVCIVYYFDAQKGRGLFILVPIRQVKKLKIEQWDKETCRQDTDTKRIPKVNIVKNPSLFLHQYTFTMHRTRAHGVRQR